MSQLRRQVGDRDALELPLVGEEEPIDAGAAGTTYVFRQGEEVPADHPAELDCPSAFIPVEEPRARKPA